jgi:hypothetical protein
MAIVESWVLTAISQVGFPIVAFLLMFYFSNKTLAENTKMLSSLHDILDEHNNLLADIRSKIK